MYKLDMDSSSILGAMQALQFGAQAANGILTLKVGAEVQAKAIELNTQIIAAQGHVMAIQQEYSEALEEVKYLKAQIERLNGIGDAKARYQLAAIGTGAYAYVLRPEAEDGEQLHWLCVNCFESGYRSVLQNKRRVNNNRDSEHSCPKCKNTVTTHWNAKPRSLQDSSNDE